MKAIPFLLIIAFLSVSMLGFTALNQDAQGIDDTNWYWKPDSYSQLVSWYQQLEENYSHSLELFKANELYGTGKVDDIYDLYYVRITNESRGLHKPETLFLGGPHGDETAGTIGLYWFTDWLMRYAYHPDFDTPERKWLQWLINNREIYIEVCHNPYGFDYVQRWDNNGWDLNREADYHGPGPYTGGIWGSINGQTLVEFINHHVIRTGADFHGGVRMILYPWASNHDNVIGISHLSNVSYTHAPPDFYYYDVSSLRVGDYIGDYGGDLNPQNIGTIPDTVGYEVPGGIAPWAYGADVIKNPREDEYVNDEDFGNYPGAGILWTSPEMSIIKNPSELSMGNDYVPGYGPEVRRFILHQVDLAQPYLWWVGPENNTISGDVVSLKWEVNGCLVVDQTNIQWGTNPDVISNSEYSTPVHDEFQGRYQGGTGWDNASDGIKKGVIYQEEISLEYPGDYYFVAKAQVDQVYKRTLAPQIYGLNHSYLRLVKERVDETYHEKINGTDGVEYMEGQVWWYSPVMHIRVGTIVHPRPGYLYVFNRELFPTSQGRTIIVGDIVVEAMAPPDVTRVEFFVDGILKSSASTEPFEWVWDETIFGGHSLEVRVYPVHQDPIIQGMDVTIFNLRYPRGD